MDLKNHSPKQLKISSSSTTCEDCRDKMVELVRCRKEAIEQIKTYCQSKKIDFERIMNTVKLPEKSVTYDVPQADISSVFEPKDFTKDIEEATEACKDLMMLLNIAEQKRKCPISKVVDEI